MQVNALSVDVEDYFHVEGFADSVPRSTWPTWAPRVVANTRLLLHLFARHGVRATFFVLGWVAEREPALVREIAAAGHEVACHGFEHRLIYQQTPEAFRADIRRAKGCLENLLGVGVQGYRAPSYSITGASLWALNILVEEGFHYDSSIFPVHHDRYGIPGADRFPHMLAVPAGRLVEFPPSTLRIAGFNLPIAGGAYFRLYPYWFFRSAVRHVNCREEQPTSFLVHPWEMDPAQPALPGKMLNQWRHRVNLHRTQRRLERLLGDFAFAPLHDVLARTGELACPG